MSCEFQNPTESITESSLNGAPNLNFEREDWTSFTTVEGLTQKGGVSEDKLPRLVLKELADNGLDIGEHINVGKLANDFYFVEDDGPGIKGTPKDIAQLFSVNRNLISSKLLRRVLRGALGNGLRVVAGAVLASGGRLIVTTNNKRIELRPELHDGSTTVVSVEPVEDTVTFGTRVEAMFGPALPCDNKTLSWANYASKFNVGEKYTGKSSPFWYDAPHFYGLFHYAKPDTLSVRELIAELDGCTGGKAGEIVNAAGLQRTLCKDITPEQAADLLKVARLYAKPVRPQRLGAMGAEAFPDHAYARVYGTTNFGSERPKAEIPFVVEAWAIEKRGGNTKLGVCVNRTIVSGDHSAQRDGREINFFGCNLHHKVTKAVKDAQYDIWLNIITPFMPIISDGKEPNLQPFFSEIRDAVGKAVHKAHRPKTREISEKQVILDNLDEVVAAQGRRFNQRNVYYGMRPIIFAAFKKELKIGNFTRVITEYESDHGDIPGMYREPRGSITFPHTGETLALGTLMVENFERPSWLFHKLAYIEKEGANEALKDAGWLERHDCTVMSSKGYGTRAAKDLIDMLTKHKEPITVYAVTDADAFGTMIMQTLQEATKARKARHIKIIHLGLHPWEAVGMGLEIETVEVKQNKDDEDKRKPVADYVKAADASGEYNGEPIDPPPGGGTWEEWLQTHRIELNAMTTPAFIEWLDRKMSEVTEDAEDKPIPPKLIPPEEVIEAELKAKLEAAVRGKITERILREAGLDRQVEDAVEQIELPTGRDLTQDIKDLFELDRAEQWRTQIDATVDECLKKVT